MQLLTLIGLESVLKDLHCLHFVWLTPHYANNLNQVVSLLLVSEDEGELAGMLLEPLCMVLVSLLVVIHFHAVDSILEFVQKWLEPGLENATVLISHMHEYQAF